jgi:hypothetical protein
MDHWALFFPQESYILQSENVLHKLFLGAHFQKNQPSPVGSRFDCMVALAKKFNFQPFEYGPPKFIFIFNMRNIGILTYTKRFS